MMAEREFVNKFYGYLISKYPEDNNIKLWFQEYDEKFGKVKVKPALKRTRSVVKQELKTKLLQSYSKDRSLQGEVPVDLETDTEEKCLLSLKLLQKHIESDKRDIIYKKVQVGKDQEKAQSEKDSHSKNRGGKKPN